MQLQFRFTVVRRAAELREFILPDGDFRVVLVQRKPRVPVQGQAGGLAVAADGECFILQNRTGTVIDFIHASELNEYSPPIS